MFRDINSQWWSGEGMTDDEVSIDPEVFSPDNDGRDDILHISCHPGRPGWLATVAIYDSRGRKVASVAGNELISPAGSFSWDGRCDAGGTAAAGIYVIFIELLDTDGVVKHYRKTAAVAVRR